MENNNLFIEVISEADNNQRKTFQTGVNSSNISKLLEFDTNQISSLANTIKEFSSTFAETIISDEMELEFSIGFTANGNICILSGSSSLGMKVRLKWKKN